MVLVGIPVHQRGELVRRCFATAAELELPAGSEIVVFDDASPTLDVPGLIALSGLSATYRRNAASLGADGMIARLWEHFLDSSHERLLFFDSDMIANRDTLVVARRFVATFPGLLSLYNSRLHPGTPLTPELIGKPVVGNAGTFWSRDLAELALRRSDRSTARDFSYCRLFASEGIAVAATRQSRMQHLGVQGANNRMFGQLEHGLGFVPDAPAQWQALGFAYDELMRNQAAYLPKAAATRASARSLLGRLGRRFRLK
jgi:hypothetical protein